ncbi:MAG: NUDIX hydrolase [Planctomycetota bacterium]
MRSSGFTLTTLGYVRDGDRVLMLERTKAPNLGEVIAPGGKLLPEESPRECVERELAEETGLTVPDPRLRAVITQTADDPSERWMLFIFLADAFAGTLRDDCPEGRLFWCPIAELLAGGHPIPAADRTFTPWLFDDDPGVIMAKFWHAADLSVERFERYQ